MKNRKKFFSHIRNPDGRVVPGSVNFSLDLSTSKRCLDKKG